MELREGTATVVGGVTETETGWVGGFGFGGAAREMDGGGDWRREQGLVVGGGGARASAHNEENKAMGRGFLRARGCVGK
jgi:hypothetical protein